MFDQPFVRPSFLQEIDPRFRLVGAALSAIVIALLQTIHACWLGLGLAVVLLALSRPPLVPLFRRLAVINVFILFLWCVTPWTTPGNPLLHAGPFVITSEGLLLSLLVTLKSNAIACVLLALVATMNSSTLGCALEQLRCPEKLVFLFLFTSRYIHVLANEWQNLIVAARLRGFVPRTNLHTYNTLASLLGLLLVRSHDRSQRVHEAMLLRGFAGHFRTVTQFRTRRRDYFFMFVLILCLMALIWQEGAIYV